MLTIKMIRVYLIDQLDSD